MKLRNFAMNTEDKITEIFRIADDFCKFFDKLFGFRLKIGRKNRFYTLIYHKFMRLLKRNIKKVPF